MITLRGKNPVAFIAFYYSLVWPDVFGRLLLGLEAVRQRDFGREFSVSRIVKLTRAMLNEHD